MTDNLKELLIFCVTILMAFGMMLSFLAFWKNTNHQYSMLMIESGYEQRIDPTTRQWVWQKSSTGPGSRIAEVSDEQP